MLIILVDFLIRYECSASVPIKSDNSIFPNPEYSLMELMNVKSMLETEIMIPFNAVSQGPQKACYLLITNVGSIVTDKSSDHTNFLFIRFLHPSLAPSSSPDWVPILPFSLACLI